ncbi:MAG: outer membrane beta-barrel protein [Ignavibacteriales bacterium]|nr:outer membrane beta-barrel protein [Ignavibacteriales bacterium]
MKQFAYLIISCGFLFSSVEAQSVHLSVGGGFSTMNAPGNYEFSYSIDRMSSPGKFEEMAGQKADIGFHISSALEFRLRDAPVSFTTGVLYTQLYGKSDFVKAFSPLWYNTIFTSGDLTTRSNILTLKTGVQWQIISSPIAPYVSLDLLYNIVGDTKLSINNSYGNIEATVDGNTRMGLSIGGGARVALLPSMDVMIGANYSLINLITPDNQEETKSAISLTVSLLYRLL